MTPSSPRRRILGWFFFDWASQPYNTLLLTFIFAPYMRDVMGDGAAAQAAWGRWVALGGIIIALLAPVLGAVADAAGNRMAWIRVFSVAYVLGAAALWFAIPGADSLTVVMCFFVLGMVGMEFATIFTNSMLPDLGPREEIGRISGNGWAFGYLGGLIALALMLLFFAESADTGTTLLGRPPALGLDPELREGTRFVGPLTAVWYVVFMVPFFLFVRDPRPAGLIRGAVPKALRGLGRTLRGLPRNRPLFAYLAASMFYRDGLNGMYAFGGIYAAGVLGWSVVEVGIFGIVAIIAGAVFSWLGGQADARFGPRPVIATCIVVLTLVGVGVVMTTPERALAVPVPPGSALPGLVFMVLGATIGAAGGALQAASRTMMVHLADPARMTEAFGLYALTGKATSFLAPALIALVTAASGSQQWGVSPIAGLFLLGLVLLALVPKGQKGTS